VPRRPRGSTWQWRPQGAGDDADLHHAPAAARQQHHAVLRAGCHRRRRPRRSQGGAERQLLGAAVAPARHAAVHESCHDVAFAASDGCDFALNRGRDSGSSMCTATPGRNLVVGGQRHRKGLEVERGTHVQHHGARERCRQENILCQEMSCQGTETTTVVHRWRMQQLWLLPGNNLNAIAIEVPSIYVLFEYCLGQQTAGIGLTQSLVMNIMLAGQGTPYDSWQQREHSTFTG
jgi:hypothetical protein